MKSVINSQQEASQTLPVTKNENIINNQKVENVSVKENYKSKFEQPYIRPRYSFEHSGTGYQGL